MKATVELLRKGIRGALDTRLQANFKNEQAICVYDLADRLGIEVKFCSGKSFGGMYAKSSRTILVPTLRPPGRQAFTCAHELGHWYFNHGTRMDTPDDIEHVSDDNPEEQLAHTFASSLLTPLWAVKKAFETRGLNPESCTPLQMYIVATNLGVGYTTLIHHSLYFLHLISKKQAGKLLQTTPKEIRTTVLGSDKTRHLIIADRSWKDVPIDIQVGDMAILPEKSQVEGKSVGALGGHHLGLLVQGYQPGVSRAELSDLSWATFVRVSRKDYEGRSRFRHLEDPDVDERTNIDL